MENLKSDFMNIPSMPPEARSSTLQDMLKGRRTEIDFINGHVVAKGREVGIPTPLCETIVDLVKKVDRGELKMDPANIRPLERYL